MGLVYSKQSTIGTQTPWKYLDKKTCETQTSRSELANEKTIGTQTSRSGIVNERTFGTQTSTKFTEKFTSFGTDNTSAETFDQECSICDSYTEKRAVGFCCDCEQYLCYQCCKHHTKISLIQNHKIVGKEEFENEKIGNKWFDIKLVPSLKTNRFSYDVHLQFSVGTEIYFLLHDLDNFACEFLFNDIDHFDCQHYKFGYITENANLKKASKIPYNTENCTNDNVTIQYFSESKEICHLKYMSSTNCVSFKRAFTLAGVCYGVVSFNNGLAISLHLPTGFSLPDWQIHYVDFKGEIKKQIYYDLDGKALFRSPCHLVSNCTEDMLFVSDMKANAIIALGTLGEIIYKFTHDTLQSPKGLTCDEENNVYVACGKHVIQIDKHGKKSRIVLESKAKNITGLCYNRQSRKFAVVDDSPAVTYFRILVMSH